MRNALEGCQTERLTASVANRARTGTASGATSGERMPTEHDIYLFKE